MRGNLFSKKEFDKSWNKLGIHLKKIEQQDGLVKAIDALYKDQKEQGFIKDDLENLQRFQFLHPEDPARYLSIQYNPNRVKRFGGSGKPPQGVTEKHKNCVLCRDNIGWQHSGKQLGYDLSINDTAYTVLMNPFPLMPGHALVATREHISQGWDSNDDVVDVFSIEKIINDIIDLGSRLPGHVVFYNGINAGASVPSHFHLHIIKRMSDEFRFPLELAPRQNTINSHYSLDYPVHAWYWQGQKQDIMKNAYNWIKNWLASNNQIHDRLSANIITSLSNRGRGEIEFYFIPRDQQRSCSSKMKGIIGGLEVLGELVFITDHEKNRIDNGEVTYKQIAEILSSTCPHESIKI